MSIGRLSTRYPLVENLLQKCSKIYPKREYKDAKFVIFFNTIILIFGKSIVCFKKKSYLCAILEIGNY